MALSATSWTICDTALADPVSAETQIIAEVGADIRRVVKAFQTTGHKVHAAWHATGQALGISSRRVRSYYEGTVTSLPAVEYLTIRQRMRAWMLADIARQEIKIAHMRKLLGE